MYWGRVTHLNPVCEVTLWKNEQETHSSTAFHYQMSISYFLEFKKKKVVWSQQTFLKLWTKAFLSLCNKIKSKATMRHILHQIDDGHSRNDVRNWKNVFTGKILSPQSALVRLFLTSTWRYMECVKPWEERQDIRVQDCSAQFPKGSKAFLYLWSY